MSYRAGARLEDNSKFFNYFDALVIFLQSNLQTLNCIYQ